MRMLWLSAQQIKTETPPTVRSFLFFCVFSEAIYGEGLRESRERGERGEGGERFRKGLGWFSIDFF